MLENILIAMGLKDKPKYTITPYFFSPNNRTEYIENLAYLDEQGANIVFSKFDGDGGVIEVLTTHEKSTYCK